jgi:hypothetical protein
LAITGEAIERPFGRGREIAFHIPRTAWSGSA